MSPYSEDDVRERFGMEPQGQAQLIAGMIGLTGTPIDKGFGRSTMKRFGPLIDSYHHPAVGLGQSYSAHLIRDTPARVAHRGAQRPGQTVRRHVRR